MVPALTKGRRPLLVPTKHSAVTSQLQQAWILFLVLSLPGGPASLPGVGGSKQRGSLGEEVLFPHHGLKQYRQHWGVSEAIIFP